MPSAQLPGSTGLTQPSDADAAVSASVGNAALGGRSREEFKRAVLAGQIAHKLKQGKKQIEPVPRDQLEEVESGQLMRIEAARCCKELLEAARAALLADAAKKNPAALATSALGVASCYRDSKVDAAAWNATFDKHYAKPQNQEKMDALPGGRHGDAAVRFFINLLLPIKAPPGFSNHSNGNAVDFSTTVGKVRLGPNTSQHGQWKASWFHQWLIINAKTYRFNPLASEEWHWDWK